MEDAHLHVVRVGEFAWSTIEPEEGHYDLDWLARAVRLAEKHHIAVVIGTPTDAPPAWLTAAHPETLRVDAEGRPAEHGSRRQFNYASPEYRKFCAAIAEQLARRFGHDPDVIGWQIGNEYTDESFDPAHAPPVRGVARAQVRNARRAESRLGHRLLERDLRPLGGDSAAHRRRQSRAPAGSPPFRQRYLARLPAGADRRHSKVRRSDASSSPRTSAAWAGVTTGTTTRSRNRSIWPPGTTTWAKGI